MQRWLLILLGAWLGAANVTAQGTFLFNHGTVNFNNRYTSLDPPGGHSPVFYPDCVTLVSGDAFRAQLYAAPTGSSVAALLPVEPPVPFQTGPGAGFWVPIVVRVPFVAPGERALLQARVWEAAAGSYENAVASGYLHGASKPFETYTALGGEQIGTPVAMLGLESFCLIPEPSIFAIALLGAAAIFGLRYLKKQR